MTTYEQHTLDGSIEVIDELTGELQARKLILTCNRDCRLRCEQFMKGEEIEATFPIACDLGSFHGQGPWEPGGYTSRWISHNATEIIEMSRNRRLHSAQAETMS